MLLWWIGYVVPHPKRAELPPFVAGPCCLLKPGCWMAVVPPRTGGCWTPCNLVFPKVLVENGPIYVQDGSVWTSGGVSSGFDLTLALVEDDYGFTQAREVAQDLVMFLRRPGGQAQFSRYPLNQAKTPGPIRDLQCWILENLAEDLSVEKLAERVAMSPRNFTRVFTREAGIPPAKFVEEGRLHSARQRLEQSSAGIEQIALTSGFGNSLNLRRVFERHLQLTPTEYRERFHARTLA